MSNQLTAEAMRAIAFAQEQAMYDRSGSVRIEHIVIGLVRDENMAVAVLRGLGVSVEDVRGKIPGMAAAQAWPPEPERLTGIWKMLAPAAGKMIDLAHDEARRLKRVETGPEHLLLGVMRCTSSDACLALYVLGVSLDKARAEVRKLCDEQERSAR